MDLPDQSLNLEPSEPVLISLPKLLPVVRSSLSASHLCLIWRVLWVPSILVTWRQELWPVLGSSHRRSKKLYGPFTGHLTPATMRSLWSSHQNPSKRVKMCIVWDNNGGISGSGWRGAFSKRRAFKTRVNKLQVKHAPSRHPHPRPPQHEVLAPRPGLHQSAAVCTFPPAKASSGSCVWAKFVERWEWLKLRTPHMWGWR